MSAHQILGVLEDGESRMWAAFWRALELAETEQARLTLAKTTDPGWLMRWFGPAALQSAALQPGDPEGLTMASYALARVVEFVPPEIPVTTVLLGHSTAASLLRLIRSGSFDLVVLTPQLAHDRRLRRELPKLGIGTALTSQPHTQPDPIGALT